MDVARAVKLDLLSQCPRFGEFAISSINALNHFFIGRILFSNCFFTHCKSVPLNTMALQVRHKNWNRFLLLVLALLFSFTLKHSNAVHTGMHGLTQCLWHFHKSLVFFVLMF